MNKKTMQIITVSVVSVFCFVATLSAQTGISPDLIQQYEKQLSSGQGSAGFASSDRMNRLLGEYQKKKAAEKAGKGDTLPVSGVDTTVRGAKKAGDTAVSYSTYEMLLRGVNIQPDSQLTHLEVFGYDAFSQVKPSTFAPSDFATVPADYPINAGDEINILLWGRLNEEARLRVSRDGTINLPHIGPLSVAGLPFEVVQQNILDRITTIEGVHASVTMGEMRSIGVYIVGEVTSPGFYTISALSNLTNALFAAGGPTKRGSLRAVQLKRGGRTVATVDFYDFLLSGADRTGLRLQSGDVIAVPIVQSMAAIAGNIRRPALYELKGKTQLSDLIKLAGGVSPAGWTNRIQIERYMENKFRVVLDIDSTNAGLPHFEVRDGDIVKVFPILTKDKNAIYLSGNVWRPGKYEFREGMHITDVIPDYQSLLPETYFEYGVLLRQEPPSFLDRIIPFNLKNALENPASPDNLSLTKKDEIVIYNRDFFEPDRSVSIDGAVTKSGTYKLLENMKIRDLVLQAGGLSEDASPLRGELYRRSMGEGSVTTAKIDFCVECAMKNDSSNNHSLERSDRVYIRQKRGWEAERRVTLKGEFVYPGIYVIFEGETLGDLVKRAGGFKKDAYLAAGLFTRKSVKALEVKQKAEYLQQLDNSIVSLSTELASKNQSEEAAAMLQQQKALRDKLSAVEPLGRVIIGLTTPAQYESFALEDSDAVYVPRNLNTISVMGEVYNPATFTYDNDKKKVADYIEAAGGMKEESADKSHVYVIKANGSIITNKTQRLSSVKLEPGDAIVVPQKVRYTDTRKIIADTIEQIVKMATIAATIVTVVVAVQALQKQ
jgi:protein involved in polysaccharide export with SLBB domain